MFDFPSDDNDTLTLLEGSKVNLNGGAIVVDDGKVDARLADLNGVTGATVGSALLLSVADLIEIGLANIELKDSDDGRGELGVEVKTKEDVEALDKALEEALKGAPDLRLDELVISEGAIDAFVESASVKGALADGSKVEVAGNVNAAKAIVLNGALSPNQDLSFERLDTLVGSFGDVAAINSSERLKFDAHVDVEITGSVGVDQLDDANRFLAEKTGVVTGTITVNDEASITTVSEKLTNASADDKITIKLGNALNALDEAKLDALFAMLEKVAVNIDALEVKTVHAPIEKVKALYALGAQKVSGLGNEAITVTDAEVDAAELNSLDGETTETVDAIGVAKLTGEFSDVQTAIKASKARSGIKIASDFNVTLTDTSVSVANANFVDAATTGVVTASVTETDMESLALLSGTGNAYAIVVDDKTVDAAALNTLDERTTVEVDATAVEVLTGYAAAVAFAISVDTIDTAPDVDVILNAGEVAAIDVHTIDLHTSAWVNASAITKLTGTIDLVSTALSARG